MRGEKECENCMHFEVCAYVSHQLPACEDYAEAPVRCKNCIIRYDLDKCPMCFHSEGGTASLHMMMGSVTEENGGLKMRMTEYFNICNYCVYAPCVCGNDPENCASYAEQSGAKMDKEE